MASLYHIRDSYEPIAKSSKACTSKKKSTNQTTPNVVWLPSLKHKNKKKTIIFSVFHLKQSSCPNRTTIIFTAKCVKMMFISWNMAGLIDLRLISIRNSIKLNRIRRVSSFCKKNLLQSFDRATKNEIIMLLTNKYYNW